MLNVVDVALNSRGGGACEALGIDLAKGGACMADPKDESLQFFKKNYDGLLKCFWHSMAEAVDCMSSACLLVHREHMDVWGR